MAPNLKLFSAVTVGACLWRKRFVEDKADLILRINIAEMNKEVMKAVDDLNLPQYLHAYLQIVLEGMLEHVRIIVYRYPISLRTHLIWTNIGTVDRVKSYVNSLCRVKNNEGCITCCADDVFAAVNAFTSDIQPFNAYWRLWFHDESASFVVGDGTLILFKLAIAVKCSPAVEYIWTKLKKNAMVHAVSGVDSALANYDLTMDSSITIQLLLSKLGHEQFLAVFKKWSIRLLHLFSVDWPYCAYFNALIPYVVHIPQNNFVKIISHLVTFTRQKPSSRFMLSCVWKHSTPTCRKRMLSKKGLDCMHYLIVTGDLENAFMIADDESLEGRGREKLIVENKTLFWDLITNNKFMILNELVETLYETETERLRFMMTIMNGAQLKIQIDSEMDDNRIEMAYVLLRLFSFTEEEAQMIIDGFEYNEAYNV